MNACAQIGEDGRVVAVRLPLAIRKRGGRKLVVTPDDTSAVIRPQQHVDSAMFKAIARAFRWRKLLETGVHSTVEEIAAAEKINASYVGRVLRLTLLAPDIIDTIINGRQPAALQLDALMRPFPVAWGEQRATFSAEDSCLIEAIKR